MVMVNIIPCLLVLNTLRLAIGEFSGSGTIVQGSCNVTSINPPDVTIVGGVLSVAYGTKNVMIQCSCSDVTKMFSDPIRWFNPDGSRVVQQINRNYLPTSPYFAKNPDNRNIVLVIPTFNDSYNGTYSCGFGKDFPPREPNINVDLTFDYTAEFYIGYFRGKYVYFGLSIVLMTTDVEPVFYTSEAPWVRYHTNGTITAGYTVTVDLPSSLTVLSLYDQSKGICVKTSSKKVTVQGNPQGSCNDYYYYCWRHYYYMRQVETFAVIPVTGLCTNEYEYYAVSVNSSSSYYNSSVLVVGTADNTVMKLIVTQSVTISMCNIITHLTPYTEYSLMINRLQTVYIGSPDDLTGSKIITNKEVSVFSGHPYGYMLNSEPSHVIKQIPSTVLWGKVHYVMPFKDVPAGYAIKMVASSHCTIKIYCNSSLSPVFTVDLNDQQFAVKEFSNNEFCTIWSSSEVLVAQFSVGEHFDSGYDDLIMALVPSTKQYYDQFVFSVVNNKIYPIDVYSYVNIIVIAKYYQPDEIYLITEGNKTSLDTQEWVSITINNITEAYATQVNVTYGVVEIFHTNEAALMTVMVYGFSSSGSYGTAINSHNARSIPAPEIVTHPTDLTTAASSNAVFKCSASACNEYSFEWKRINSDLPKKSSLSNIGATSFLTIPNVTSDDVGEYYCVAWSNNKTSQSNAAKLQFSVPLKPVFLLEPFSQNVYLSQTAVFTCVATGHEVKYQWMIKSGSFPSKVSGINHTTLVIPNVQVSDANYYTCVVSNEGGNVSSNTIRLTVLGQPEVEVTASSETVEVTHSVMLIANASGMGVKNFKYQWQRTNKMIEGETKPFLLINNILKKSSKFHTYRCNVSDEYGNIAVSNSLSLLVNRNLPVFKVHPQNTELLLNGTNLIFSLTCNAIGALSYRWNKQDGDISSSAIGVNTNNLTFINIRPADSGNYYCVAINGSGRRLSDLAVVTIKVIPPQQLHVVPTFANVYLAQTATFICSAAGHNVSYHWKIGLSFFPKKVTGINTNTLVIPNVGLSDDNRYTCVASNEGGRMSSKAAQLTVIDLPSVTVMPSIQTVEVTNNAILVAKVTGTGVKNITYQWRHNGRIIKGKSSNTLIIYKVKESDGGDYVCFISNNHVNKVPSNKVQLLVTRNLPAIFISPREAFVSLGANTSLTCKVDDVSSYYWERKDGNIPSSAIGVNSSTLTLINFNNLQLEGNGEYRCVATNGSGTSKSDYAAVKLNKFPPKITEHPQNLIIDVYTSIVLKCKSLLFGNVQIYWQKNGSSRLPRTASVTNTRSQDELISTLNITKALTYYSGSYYCNVKNEKGEANSSHAQLQVKIPCPEITKLPVNITVLPSNVSQFSCMAFSFGNLKYEWKRKGFADLPPNTMASLKYLEQELTFYSLLTINNSNETLHEGWYCCVVTNECGDVEECAWLEVDNTPVIVKHPKSIVVGEHTKASLECLANGRNPIYYQWEKHSSSNDSWIIPHNINITSPELVFDVINEKDEGVYHCTASNDDGIAISNNATITVYGKPNITYITKHKVSLEGKKVKLICRASNDVDAILPLQIKWCNSSGKEIQQDTRHFIHNSNVTATAQLQSVLLFDPVNYIDSQTYTCKAFNHPQYYTAAESTLTIEYIRVTPQSPHTVCVGDHVTLWCRGKALLIPTVQWYQGDKPLKPPEQIVQICPVPTDSPHNTTYTCVARNFTGNVDCPVTVNVTVIVKATCAKSLTVPNGYVFYHGCQDAIFVCQPGYVLRGTRFANCTGGKWQPDLLPRCEKIP